MTLTSALNNAVSGLQVNQRGLEIASHNIANATTEGYSRRTVVRAPNFTGDAGPAGVKIIDIQRAANQFLTQQVRTEVAGLGRSEVRDRYLGNTQDLFGTLSTDSSIGQRLATMAERMESLAVEPESSTAAASLVDAALVYVRDLNAISDEIQRLRVQADLEIENAVAALNEDLALVADLNEKIAGARITGDDAGDLMDQRDLALKRIGTEINIKTFERSNGETVILTGDSTILLDGKPTFLSYSSSAAGYVGATFGQIERPDGVSIQSSIRDGRIKGLLEVRDSVLPNLHRQMDALTQNTRDIVNAAHNRGMGLPAAATLSGSRTFADTATDQVTIGSDVRFAITDSSGLTVATFDLPAGTYTIDDLAAAIDAGLGADGSASIVGGALVVSAADPANGIGMVDLNNGADAAISFDDGSGPVAFSGFSNFFGLNDFFQTPGNVTGDNADNISGIVKVRSDLVSNPEFISRGRLADGAVAPVPGTDRAIAIGDGRIMAEVAATLSAPRAIPATGGLPPINKPLNEYAAEIVGLNSQLAAEEGERLKFEEALVGQFETRLTDTTGVNIDEELANILVLQTAFSASARLVTTADEMMQTLVQMKR